MARERKTNNWPQSSPDERYRKFAADNAAWDSRVKKSIAEIEKASRAKSRQLARS